MNRTHAQKVDALAPKYSYSAEYVRNILQEQQISPEEYARRAERDELRK